MKKVYQDEIIKMLHETSSQLTQYLKLMQKLALTKGTTGPTAHPGAAVGVLFGLVDVLAHRVLDLVLVVCLIPDEGLQKLHFLLDNQLVDLGQVRQSRGTVGGHHCRLGSGHHAAMSPRGSHCLRLLGHWHPCLGRRVFKDIDKAST